MPQADIQIVPTYLKRFESADRVCFSSGTFTRSYVAALFHRPMEDVSAFSVICMPNSTVIQYFK